VSVSRFRRARSDDWLAARSRSYLPRFDALIPMNDSRPIDSTRANAPVDPLRVLLWSPTGSCEGRYGGPCTYSARLYAAAPPSAAHVTLAHGVRDHPLWPRNDRQEFVSEILPRGGRLRQALFIRRAASWIRREHRNFDIFHGITAFHFSLAPAIEAKRRGLPVAIVLANSSVELSTKGLAHALTGVARRRRRWIRDMDAVICLSREIEEEVRLLGVREAAIARIPNQCDIARFRPAVDATERTRCRIESGWPDRFTVLLVGELVPRKRPHLVIEALRLLVDRGIDAQVALVGPFNDARYATVLKDQAMQLGVQGRVIFEPDYRKVEFAYRAADAFCLPSQNEGMPGSVIEASASGLPVVVCDFSSAYDCVRDGLTGTVLRDGPNISQRIAQELCFLRENPTESAERSLAGRKLAETTFSSVATWSAHQALFARIIGASRG
jgi:glycosyltransferase involved in cell wall biosynthesis